MKKQQELTLRMLDKKLSHVKDLYDLERPSRGWIRAIRESIGMTTQQLAKRLGVSLSRVSAIEKDESLGNLKISTLERAAKALGCRLVYTFVPHIGLYEMVQQRAEEKARLITGQAHHTMGLEDQQVLDAEQKALFDRLVKDLLDGKLARLWDVP